MSQERCGPLHSVGRESHRNSTRVLVSAFTTHAYSALLSLSVTPTYTTGRHMTTSLTHPYSGPSFAYRFASQMRFYIPCVSPGVDISKLISPTHTLSSPNTSVLTQIPDTHAKCSWCSQLQSNKL